VHDFAQYISKAKNFKRIDLEIKVALGKLIGHSVSFEVIRHSTLQGFASTTSINFETKNSKNSSFLK
jgi:hypothetical protein